MKTTVCAPVRLATGREPPRTESEPTRAAVLAFAVSVGGAPSSDFELLQATASAAVVMTISASPLPQSSRILLVIFMLVARHLTKQYRSGEHELTVLHDVSFSLPQGA